MKHIKVKKKDLSISIGGRCIRELSKNKCLYIMAIPVLLYYLIFCYGPMFGIVIAFKKFEIAKGIFGSSWVGLQYFKEFFNGLYFIRILKNTFLISFYDLLFNFPAPIILALLLNELKSKKFKRCVQTITYLPHFISLVVVCGMLRDFLSSDGVLTLLIQMMGGETKNYIGEASSFRTIFVASNIWQGIGWSSIIYIAALAGVPQELYEAAEIDGAGRYKQLVHITLPGIANTIIVMLILRIGQLMSVGYEKIILLYSPGTYETADVISSYVYRVGLGNSRYSFSAAVGIFQSVINFVLLLISNGLSKKYTETSLF